MIVRLRSLSARVPGMGDLKEVTSLMAACDAAEAGLTDPTEEDVHSAWQVPGFCLKTDAWVIVTNTGQIVGYADVRREGEKVGKLTFALYVHPDYRGRGIGTLLIWMVEERARQMMSEIPAELRVTLSHTVSSLNAGARRLLEREGYAAVRHFLRLLIEMEEAAVERFDDDGCGCGKVRMDLVVDAQSLLEPASVTRRTGIYVARQYDVYEKELRAGKKLYGEERRNEEFVTA